MNKNPINILEVLKSIGLSAQESQTMRENLFAYADFHPVRTSPPLSYMHRITKYLSFVTHSRLAYGLASLLLVIVTGAGTSFAAQKTLPGDALYAVKINLNERVETAFAFTPKSKALVHAQLAERRLTEVTVLAIAENLTPDNRVALVDNFKTHVVEADSATQSIRDSGNAEESVAAQSDLDSRVAAGAHVIALLRDHVNIENQKEIRQVLDTVRPTPGETKDASSSVVFVGGGISTSKSRISPQEASAFIKDADIVRVALEARGENRRTIQSSVGREDKDHKDKSIGSVASTTTLPIATTSVSTSTRGITTMMVSTSAPLSSTTTISTSTEVKVQENINAKVQIHIQNNPNNHDEVSQWDKKIQEVLKQETD